jgi:hypothetical protein
MFGFSKKKNKDVSGMPPLPDQLPPIDNTVSRPNQQTNANVPNIHDQIPNDIHLNEPLPQLPPMDGLSPDTLPSIEDVPTPEEPNPENFREQIPPNVSLKQLPEIPMVKDDIKEVKPIVKQETPSPNVDDSVPKPPAIFSEDGFYETPEEIKHLLKEERKDTIREDYVERYHLSDVEDKPVKELIDKPQIRNIEKQGPIFVDIESFRRMLGDIDTIKNDIKASEMIIQHLNEIKNSKDKELDRWRSSLEDMQRKLNYVDKVLFNEA